MELVLDDKARDLLGEAGFDPVYGARPLKRAIQQQIENPLAQRILRGDFGPGDRVRVRSRRAQLAFRRGRHAIIPQPMPFYEYECENCKFYTELLQKVSDPPLSKCPSCGKKRHEEAGLGAGVPPQGRRLVRDGLQVATRKTSAISPSTRSRSPRRRMSKPAAKPRSDKATERSPRKRRPLNRSQPRASPSASGARKPAASAARASAASQVALQDAARSRKAKSEAKPPARRKRR